LPFYLYESKKSLYNHPSLFPTKTLFLSLISQLEYPEVHSHHLGALLIKWVWSLLPILGEENWNCGTFRRSRKETDCWRLKTEERLRKRIITKLNESRRPSIRYLEAFMKLQFLIREFCHFHSFKKHTEIRLKTFKLKLFLKQNGKDGKKQMDAVWLYRWGRDCISLK